MKKIIFLVALVTLAAFVSGVMAQGKSATAPAKAAPATTAPEKPAGEKFRGVIEKVDGATKTIIVKGKVQKEEKTLTFIIDEKTKIAKDKTALPFSELKKGMEVSVGYIKDGDKLIAVGIRVAGAGPAPKGAEAPK